jgi:hypothetical protein
MTDQRLTSTERKALDVVAGEAHMEALQELSQWSHNMLAKQTASVQVSQANALRDDMAMIQEAFSLSGIEDFNDGELR